MNEQKPQYSICIGCGNTIPVNTLKCDSCLSPQKITKPETITTNNTTTTSGSLLTGLCATYFLVSFISAISVLAKLGFNEGEPNWIYIGAALGITMQGWIVYLFASNLTQIHKDVRATLTVAPTTTPTTTPTQIFKDK